MGGLIDLMQSANFNCEKTAELLVKEEGNGDLGMTPLLKAATLGILCEVNALLAAGEDADIRHGSHELSLLDAAALMGHLKVARVLLDHGADVNSAGNDGYTSLLCSVQYGRTDLLEDVIDLLLSAGADINTQMDEGFTPIHLASERRDCGEVTAMLLQRGADKDALNGIGRSPLHMAAEAGDPGATRVLLAAGADPSLRAYDSFVEKTPLDVAARSGHVEVIKEFARHGVDLDAAFGGTNSTALDHAARKNHAGAVDALVEAGASVTVQTLDSAACTLALEAMVALLRHGAPVGVKVPPDNGGGPQRVESTLHIAARRGGAPGAVEAVDLLLRWGADESELDYRGQTAAEVVGADVSPSRRLAADVSRVRELLANAPADRTWRRRGLLLLCLARTRSRPRVGRSRKSIGSTARIGSGGKATKKREAKKKGKGKGKGKGRRAEDGVLAKDVGGGGSGGGAVPSPADVGAAPVAGRGKRERSPPEIGGGGGGGSSADGREVGLENGTDFDGVVAMLREFEEEGFFRTIVRFL